MARRPRAQKTLTPQRLILDSGAVISWSRGNVRTRALLTRALELGVDIRIPVAVLVETLRGGPGDAPVHRVRNAVDVMATTEQVGRMAGVLLGQTGGKNTLDALVAAEAIALVADALTGDGDDMRELLSRHPEIAVIEI